ncbi:MAG TPA: hypothetical protein VGA99_08795 [bacterium]
MSVSNDNRAPDLLVGDVIYSVERERSVSRAPTRPTPGTPAGGPHGRSGPLHCSYVFNLLIENAGESSWQGQLILCYSFSQKDFDKKNYLKYEKVTLDTSASFSPYQIQEYSLPLTLIECRIDKIFFIINPEELGEPRESFYGNNEWVQRLEIEKDND